MVRPPVVHHFIRAAENTLAGKTRCKPSRRPRRVGALVEGVVHLVRQFHSSAFSDLQAGSKVCAERFRRIIVEAIPPRVLKRVLQPPPGKYSVMLACQVVASRQALASSSEISQKGFMLGCPWASLWRPQPSRAAGPELMRCRRPSAAGSSSV